jgi:repressor LexA
MADLSKKQAAVRNFIASEQAAGRSCPSHREIAAHFGFASSYAAACHVKALIRKGALVAEGGIRWNCSPMSRGTPIVR